MGILERTLEGASEQVAITKAIMTSDAAKTGRTKKFAMLVPSIFVSAGTMLASVPLYIASAIANRSFEPADAAFAKGNESGMKLVSSGKVARIRK